MMDEFFDLPPELLVFLCLVMMLVFRILLG